MNSAFVDGLDEAARGLWRSAADSFETAARDLPEHPAPVLALAVCLLELGRANEAIVLLETAAPLVEPSPEWAQRARWLAACARLAAADPLGAEQDARELPRRERRAVNVATAFATQDWASGVALLLENRRAERPTTPVRVDV